METEEFVMENYQQQKKNPPSLITLYIILDGIIYIYFIPRLILYTNRI